LPFGWILVIPQQPLGVHDKSLLISRDNHSFGLGKRVELVDYDRAVPEQSCIMVSDQLFASEEVLVGAPVSRL